MLRDFHLVLDHIDDVFVDIVLSTVFDIPGAWVKPSKRHFDLIVCCVDIGNNVKNRDRAVGVERPAVSLLLAYLLRPFIFLKGLVRSIFWPANILKWWMALNWRTMSSLQQKSVEQFADDCPMMNRCFCDFANGSEDALSSCHSSFVERRLYFLWAKKSILLR